MQYIRRIKLEPKCKYAVVTSEGEVVDIYNNRDFFTKEESAKNALEKHIQDIKESEERCYEYSKTYTGKYVNLAEILIKEAEAYQVMMKEVETYRIAKIEISPKIVG